MCTAIAKKGNDLLYGFNLDIDPGVWSFDIYKTNNYFTIGIKVGKTVYFTHGVNRNGHFSNVPYMNGERFKVPKGSRRERIDLMADRYIRGKYSFEEINLICQTKSIVSIPAATMHSLVGNEDGKLLIIEPGYGFKKVDDDFAVIANFPVLTTLDDYSNPFYGKDRYDKAKTILESAGECFSVQDALNLLYDVRQGGKWGTRVSFVYSKNENSVYYFLDGDMSKVEVHRFK